MKMKNKSNRIILVLSLPMLLPILLPILLMVLTISFIHAQVASPPLNITQHSFNPAVVAFNPMQKIITLGVRAGEGDGEKNINNTQKETKDITALEANASLHMFRLGLEAYSMLQRKDKIKEKLAESTTASSEKINSAYQVNFAYRPLPPLSLGFSTGEEQVTVNYDKTKFKKNGAGIDLMLFNFLYVGAATFRVSHQSSYTIENNWWENLGGIALIFAGRSNAIRIEASYSTSPEDLCAHKDSNPLAQDDYHQESKNLVVGGEIYLSEEHVTKFFGGSLDGVILGASKGSEKREPLAASIAAATNVAASAGSSVEEKIDRLNIWLLLVMINKKIQLGPSFHQYKSNQDTIKRSENLILISAGVMF
ncbi:MAG: hypothetical protein HQK53_02090 [Oligoflexia bacterium]|nr:hypothetical protein [Oligoflexia bacterium]